MSNNIIPKLKKKYRSIITVSFLCGGCFSLSFINNWSYFWRRSLPVQLFLLVLITIASVSLLYLLLRRKPHYLHTFTKNKKKSLFVIIAFVSMLLLIILSPFTSLSPFIPVTHTIKIRALDDKNPVSRSNGVKLLEIKINGKIIPLESFNRSGDWVHEEEAFWIRGDVPLIFNFKAKSDSIVEILFKKSPSGGLVQIEYDNQEPIVKDLFYSRAGTSIVLPSISLFGNNSLLLVIVLSVIKYIAIFGLVYVVLIIYLIKDKRMVLYRNLIVFLGLILAFYQFQVNFGFDKIVGGMEYFSGKKGAIEAYGPVITYGEGTGDRSDIFTCLEILNKVPGPAPVLNLNGFAAVEPCLFSPLLPRDKIVHHYESVTITEPYYQTLMFGEPEDAYAIYRKLGIDYFYIRKNDFLFVNLGYSLALEPQNLEQYFDVYAESNDFYILTWRGQGQFPVTHEIEQDISAWYENSKKTSYFWWKGKLALDGWVQADNLR